MADYRVYLNDGTCEGVKNVRLCSESARGRTIFFEDDENGANACGNVKAIYMDNAVSRIVMDE